MKNFLDAMEGRLFHDFSMPNRAIPSCRTQVAAFHAKFRDHGILEGLSLHIAVCQKQTSVSL